MRCFFSGTSWYVSLFPRRRVHELIHLFDQVLHPTLCLSKPPIDEPAYYAVQSCTMSSTNIPRYRRSSSQISSFGRVDNFIVHSTSLSHVLYPCLSVYEASPLYPHLISIATFQYLYFAPPGGCLHRFSYICYTILERHAGQTQQWDRQEKVP